MGYKEELGKGEIPDIIREALHLLTAPTPDAQRFQEQMTQLTAELIGQKATDALGIRFYLTDEKYKNAGKVNFARPPIIVFSGELMEALDPKNLEAQANALRAEGMAVPDAFAKNGKGMLLGILAHELKHIEFGDRNSKGIEASCDQYAVDRLIARGYRKESLGEALKYLLTDATSIDTPDELRNLREYLDVHPITDNRIRLMENEFFRQVEGEGKLKLDADGHVIIPDPVALPEELRHITGSQPTGERFDSWFKRMLKEQAITDSSSVVDKIDAINTIVKDRLDNWSLHSRDPRVADIVEYVVALDLHAGRYSNDSPEKKALDSLDDTLNYINAQGDTSDIRLHQINLKNSYQKIHEAITHHWFGAKETQQYLGTIGQVEQTIRRFIDAAGKGNKAETLKAAKEIEAISLGEHAVTPKMPAFASPNWSDLVDIEDRIYDDTGKAVGRDKVGDAEARTFGFKPPWHEAVSWTLENESNQVIGKALWKIGITDTIDPRLKTVAEAIKGEALDPFNTPNKRVLAHENGYIIGLASVVNLTEPEMRKRLELRERRLEVVPEMPGMASIDWPSLRTQDGLNAFFDSYKDLLVPDIAHQIPTTPLQARFLQEVSAGITEHKARADKQYKKSSPDYTITSETAQYNAAVRTSISRLIKLAAPDEKAGPLATNNIYVDFVRTHNRLFHYEDRLKLTAAVFPKLLTWGEHEKKQQIIGDNSELIRDIFNYKPPETAEQLFELVKTFQGEITRTDRSDYNLSKIPSEIIDFEVVEFLSKHPHAELSGGQLRQLYALGDDGAGSLKKGYEEGLLPVILNNKDHQFQLPAYELIKTYNLHQQSLFFRQHNELRESYEKAITEKLDALPNDSMKQMYLESLLLGRSSQNTNHEAALFSWDKSGSKFLSNPHFRDWAIDSWVECSAASMAKTAETKSTLDQSDKNNKYFMAAFETANKVIDRSDGITRYQMMTKWLDRIQAQKKLSYHVRDAMSQVTSGEIAELHYKAAAGEAFLDQLAFDPDIRLKTIEFLRHPTTPEGTKAYAGDLRKSAENLISGRQISGIPKFVKEKLAEALKGNALYDKVPEVAEYTAKMVHRNFASAPTEYKAFLMEKILFPPNSKSLPMAVDPEKYVFDQTLPDTDAYAKYGRSLIGNYLGTLRTDEEYVKRMYLSAMLVAEDMGGKETDPKKRLGKAIHTLLNSMDNPLAVKISQTIDSTPDIPDWLRNPESKTSTNIPPRWVIHEMFDQYAGKDVRETTERLGKVRAGAIGITVELDKKTGEMKSHGYAKKEAKTVFKMVRKGAAEKVALHAPRLRQMIDRTVAELPELASARSIMQHASDAARIETDFRNAPLQTHIASQLTDNINVNIRGHKYTFHEIPILKANSTSHEMSFAEGVLFNDLPAERKAEVAQAVLSLENYLLLRGVEIDWDRHGAQLIINGRDIFLLDRGGMAMQAPSEPDKALLGQILGMSVNAHVEQNTPFAQAFQNAAETLGARDNHYIATILRAQHNLGDLRRELSPAQQMEAMMAAFPTRQVDGAIFKGAVKNLSEKSQEWLKSQFPTPSWTMLLKRLPIAIKDPHIGKERAAIDASKLLQPDEPREEETSFNHRAKTARKTPPDTFLVPDGRAFAGSILWRDKVADAAASPEAKTSLIP